MYEHLKQPLPWSETNLLTEYKTLNEILSRQEVRRTIEIGLIQIIGPLTVAERWETFGDYGLAKIDNGSEDPSDIRARIDWQGPTDVVASRISTEYLNWGFPATVLLIQMMEDKKYGLVNDFPEIGTCLEKLMTPASNWRN